MKEENYYLKVSRYSDLEDKNERILYRFLEMLTGLISWSVLISAILCSYFYPLVAACVIVVYAVYWFFRSIYFSIHLRSGYAKMKKSEKTDWLAKLKELDPVDIYHLVIVPTYDESEKILRNTIQSIVKNDYPLDKIILVLAFEERAGGDAVQKANNLKQEFDSRFFKVLTTFHPKDIPGEIAGKSSNEAWATKVAKKEVIDKLNIPYEDIILTSLDSDTIVYPKYFSCLTYLYRTVDNPTRSSFQPVPLYINNIWEASPVSRIFAFSSTFWHTINQERPEKLVTFSSHSMSFQALIDIDFKQTNVVSEDSRVFWQCFLKYDGDYKTVPMYYPVSMDANAAPTIIQTAANIYKQTRRWAYGVENIPYFIFGFIKNKNIPMSKKVPMFIEMIEGKVSWAVFLVGCNFRCPWCYSPEIVLPDLITRQPKISQKELFDFLNSRKGLLDGVVICGGEPTIQPELFDFLAKIKSLGFKIKLDTNGSNPEAIREVLDKNLVQYIAMDIKSVLDSKRYQEATGSGINIDSIIESINLIKGSNIDYEFRTTVVPAFHSVEDIIKIAQSIAPAKKYFIQSFRAEKNIDSRLTSVKPYSEEVMQQIKEKIHHLFEVCSVR
jgi:anaerobic ribonucleoside-triphosphate reductase activating protein